MLVKSGYHLLEGQEEWYVHSQILLLTLAEFTYYYSQVALETDLPK